MKKTIVGNKYAMALFQLAIEKNETEKIENDLRVVKEVFETTSELYSLLNTPNISLGQKKKVISDSFSGLSEYVQNTLMMLIDRHRVEHILPMISAFIDLNYDRKGIAQATVESVRPLTEEEVAVLSSEFAKKVDKNKLEIVNVVNTDLLGGLKIRIKNRIFDGSLKGKLNRLERNLIGNQL